MAGKPSAAPSAQERALAAYRQLQLGAPNITKRAAAQIIAAEWGGAKVISVLRYLADADFVQPPAPVVESGPPLPSDPAEAWAQIAADNRARIEYGELLGKATIRTDDALPIGLCFLTDQHIGSKTTDMERMEYDAAIIRETPGLYAVLGGDAIDNFGVILKLARPGLAAAADPGEQYALAAHYLEMFGGKILAMIAGNHEAWTDRVAAVDVLAGLARQQCILYDPDEFEITLKHGGQVYQVLIRHKAPFNSSFNLTHVCKQLIRQGRYATDPDIVVLGHHHAPAVEYAPYKGQYRAYIRTGSYKVVDDYSRQHAFSGGGYMVPTVILHPDQRKLVVEPTLEDAADRLAYLRG